tara:strand:+ start:720 stop:1367 length:648 start_codon:yes stop_codon:yes gene_type:complete
MNIMPQDLMTLRDLRVQTFKERKEGKLTKLPSDFYTRTKNLEGQIKEVISRSKGEPKKLEKANADIRKLLDMKLELHKHRERKLTDLAREKINGQTPDITNVHQNEREYLDSICEVIENYRRKNLMDHGENVYEEPKKIKEKKEPETIKEEANEIIKDEEDEYLQVEILEDLPTFIGMDAKNYTLKNNEIEKIPIYNAKVLSDAGKVKIIKEVKA